MSIITKKQIVIISIIISICILKMYFVTEFLNKNCLPVYDGVMNEKGQIIRYLNFKYDFSFKNRLIQAYLELIGNPVCSIFNIIIIIINPKLLINNLDVYFRGGLVILSLSFSIFNLLKCKENSKLIILGLISIFPLFHHFRFGLMTYIPDLSSGVLLISAYINLYLFIKSKSNFNFINILWMMIFAIGFRFNFFVYSTLLFLPFVPITIKTILNQSRKKKIFLIILIIFFLIFLLGYIYIHIDFFLSYYLKPATYTLTNLEMSIKSFNDYCVNELGLSFILIFLCILLLNNRETENKKNFNVIKYNIFLIYPFIVFYLFLIIYFNSVNQPHVFSFLVFSSTIISFTKSKTLSRISNMLNKKILTMLILFTFLLNNYEFAHKLNKGYKQDLKFDSGIILATKIERELRNIKHKKYFILFGTGIEMPLDVYFYHKTKKWNDNQLKFYFTEWDFYSISKKLLLKEIVRYYQNEIERKKISLILLNSKDLILTKDKQLSVKVNQELRKLILNSNKYILKDTFNYKEQKIYILKRKS